MRVLGLSRRRRTHQELARLPGWFKQGQLGRNRLGPNSRYAFVVSQDVGAFGWIEKTKRVRMIELPSMEPSQGRGNFEVHIGGVVWPSQKPP
jgi:hypothetical protein